MKEFFIPNNDSKDSYGSAGIRHVEDGREEALPSPQWAPIWNFEEFEVKHIHYATVKKWGIVPNHSIEKRINNIADSAGNDERQNNNHRPCCLLLFYEFDEVVNNKSGYADPH